jgi:hypothetical protein
MNLNIEMKKRIINDAKKSLLYGLKFFNLILFKYVIFFG